MAVKEKSTAQRVSNICGLKLLFIYFFTGPAFEYECFQALAEVGRRLSEDDGSTVCLCP